jgi:hypothetical protein
MGSLTWELPWCHDSKGKFLSSEGVEGIVTSSCTTVATTRIDPHCPAPAEGSDSVEPNQRTCKHRLWLQRAINHMYQAVQLIDHEIIRSVTVHMYTSKWALSKCTSSLSPPNIYSPEPDNTKLAN